MKYLSVLVGIITFSISFSLHAQEEKSLNLENIWLTYDYYPNGINDIRSMKDGKHYTNIVGTEYGKAIVKYTIEKGEAVDTIWRSNSNKIKGELDQATESVFLPQLYEFSPKEDYILFKLDPESIYRYSTKERTYIYDLKSKVLTTVHDEQPVSLAEFSPDQSKIAYTFENNLYLLDLKTYKETMITKDGEWNSIINGSLDWVYEEEFSFKKGFYWSGDSKNIAYYKFDESEVPMFTLFKYKNEVYPEPYTFKYPKAGEKNSELDIYIYNISSSTDTKIDLSIAYEYIPRIKWSQKNNLLSIQTLNRHQNELNFIFYDVNSNKSNVLFTEKSDTYIDIHDNLTFLNNGTQFIWSSERSGYNHLYLYDYQGNELNQITSGNWDMHEYLGFNEKSKTIYYISSESSPLNRDFYSIGIDGKNKKKLSTESGTHRITFTDNYMYYIDAFSNANTPPIYTLYNSKGKKVDVLEDNKELRVELKEMELAKKEFFTFSTENGDELNGWMIKPKDFNPNKKYPVFMHVYGGPGSQTVTNEWGGTSYMWHQHLAELGYIVVSVDNRGTGARGAEFKKCTYKQLGKLETEDQISAAKHMASLSYVDPGRIGIQGWSYGGYMSSLCLFKGSDIFKMGIAVAPVTNWKFYDSIYTERYMQTPEENEGYDDNAPINFVDSMKGKFLLVHGTGDDNVHFQNSVELVNALNNAGKHYDFYMYPNKRHGIGGGNSRYHLFTKMTSFILENL